MRANGEFEVKLQPLDSYARGRSETPLGRLSIDKAFRGDLSATSQGEMLTAGATVEGSAGYVAIELVIGSLDGRSGSFVLQHFGALDRGQPRHIVDVVPDSGTGELEGLSGTMTITIEGGHHRYALDYTVPEAGKHPQESTAPDLG